MKITSVNTRSGEATYEFISDALMGAKRCKPGIMMLIMI